MLIDCVIVGNTGDGGVSARDQSVVSRCAILGNVGQPGYWNLGWGAGIYCHGAVTIEGCLVAGNQARSDPGHPGIGLEPVDGKGGGIYCEDGTPRIVSCTIGDNAADDFGGGICSESATPIIVDSIFWGNEAPNEPAIFGNAVVSYSCVSGGFVGEGNIDTDPLFADPDNGDYHLRSQAGRREPESKRWVKDNVTSPCIDAGDPIAPIGYEPFPNGGVVNMGAYGGTAEASKSYFGEPVCETIVAADINGDCTVDWRDFELMAAHWLEDYR